jgi:hypothetical protein
LNFRDGAAVAEGSAIDALQNDLGRDEFLQVTGDAGLDELGDVFNGTQSRHGCS